MVDNNNNNNNDDDACVYRQSQGVAGEPLLLPGTSTNTSIHH